MTKTIKLFVLPIFSSATQKTKFALVVTHSSFNIRFFFVVVEKAPGLNPINKKYRKFSGNLGKFSVFKLCSYKKILAIFSGVCPAKLAAPKILARNV